MKRVTKKKGITVYDTERDYDFIAAVENESDKDVKVVFTGDYDWLEHFTVPARNWVGIEANGQGWGEKTAFECGYFEIVA